MAQNLAWCVVTQAGRFVESQAHRSGEVLRPALFVTSVMTRGTSQEMGRVRLGPRWLGCYWCFCHAKIVRPEVAKTKEKTRRNQGNPENPGRERHNKVPKQVTTRRLKTKQQQGSKTALCHRGVCVRDELQSVITITIQRMPDLHDKKAVK